MRGAVLFLGLGVALAPAPSEAHKPTTTEFTYHRDVYPIFQERCGSCHRTGGVAPMSLLSYKDAYPWAVSIKNEVLELAMPPWYADERYGAFRHVSSLTAGEVNTIVDWCLGGTPEGEPGTNENESPSLAGATWELGPPDLELEMDRPFTLGEDEMEAVHDAVLRVSLSRERLVRAVDFVPQRPNVVRSALVYVKPKDGAIGPEGILAAWIPGERVAPLSSGRGMRLPAGSDLVVRIHYEKTWLDEGSAVSDRSRLGLYFHGEEDGGAAEVVTQLLVASGEDGRPRTRDAGPETDAVQIVPEDVDLVALLPRFERRVASLRAEAVLPDGARTPLLRLREPDPDWPRKFWLVDPILLPKGSRIELTLTGEPGAGEDFAAGSFLLLDVVSR